MLGASSQSLSVGQLLLTPLSLLIFDINKAPPAFRRLCFLGLSVDGKTWELCHLPADPPDTWPGGDAVGWSAISDTLTLSSWNRQFPLYALKERFFIMKPVWVLPATANTADVFL